jgi:MazG family protein
MSGERFETLLALMARLRAPGGCPWDREQTIASLRRYLIEETYEVLDAIERRDWEALAEELGDLQLQIVFQSQIASESGDFTINDVLEQINSKLIRRHPHVFESESIDSADGVKHRWDELKAEEKRRKGGQERAESILEAVPANQPALVEAEQLGKKAAKIGFDWRRFDELTEKFKEELAELAAAYDSGDPDGLEDEIGDLLFMAVNMARFTKVNPELALKRANRKFRQRFGHIERELGAAGRDLEAAGLDEMEALWQQAKSQ